VGLDFAKAKEETDSFLARRKRERKKKGFKKYSKKQPFSTTKNNKKLPGPYFATPAVKATFSGSVQTL